MKTKLQEMESKLCFDSWLNWVNNGVKPLQWSDKELKEALDEKAQIEKDKQDREDWFDKCYEEMYRLQDEEPEGWGDNK